MKRTFSIIKPDATKRNITGSINKIIEDNNLVIIAQKRTKLSKEKAEGFLAEVRQEEVDLVKQLEDKYGVGSIDLQAGEFIPAPEAPEAKEEAPAAPEVVEE